MANLANCCLLLLPCRITRLRRATYINPKFAKHKHVPQTHLGGTSRCFARQNCRAEHLIVPPGPLQRGWRCFAFFGLGVAGISPISRTRKAILCRMRRAAVRHLPISAPGAQEEAIWWFLAGAHVRLFGGMALGGRSQNKKRSLAKWLNSVSAVRTRLENQLKHPLQTLAGVLSIAYLCQ